MPTFDPNGNLKVNVSVSGGAGVTTAVTQDTGTNLHAVVDSGTITAVTAITNPLPAGTNVIGHVVADSGSTTAVTGNVSVVQPTGTNLHVVLDTTSTTVVTQATGTNLHTVVDSGTITAVTAITNALPAGTNIIGHVINDASAAIIGKVGIDQTTPGTTNLVQVGGSLPAGTAVIGHVIVDTAPSTAVTNAGTFAVQAALNAETTKVIGTVNVAAAQTIAATQATAANLNATIVGPTLTKGTQGATGLSTQDLKDAGRTYVTLTADAVTPAASETVLTFAKNVGGTVTAGVTTYAVTAGKTLRIQAIFATLLQSSTTVVGCRLRLRHNTAGAAVATSPLVATWQLATPATTAVANTGLAPQDVAIPDGLEIKQNSTDNITLSAIATSAAGTLSVTLVGYEY